MPYFNPDQYNHLLKLIDKDSVPKEALANMACIVCPVPSTFNTSHACSVVGNETFPWIVDTGDAHHMVSSLDTYLILFLLTPRLIVFLYIMAKLP